MDDLTDGGVNFEREKVELERQKICLEREKLAIERSKIKWTALSIFIPLLIAALTFTFNVWGQERQSRAEFELKAADVVMQAGTPEGTRNRARALAALFPDRLPIDFANSFDPKLYSSTDSGAYCIIGQPHTSLQNTSPITSALNLPSALP